MDENTRGTTIPVWLRNIKKQLLWTRNNINGRFFLNQKLNTRTEDERPM